MFSIEASDIIPLMLTGFAAGVLGGLLGIGGSIIMIPAMALLFARRDWSDQHLLQAAAMLVNVVVALPAALKHRKMGAFRVDLFRAMLPATIVFIIIGVLVSDQLDSFWLRRLFALFLIYTAVTTIAKALQKRPPHEPENERVTRVRGGFVGAVMGFLAGLLGIGGGGIAVPLAHVVCRLRLKNCIAVSSMIMCITAGIGAALKISLLPGHGHAVIEPFVLFLCLAPTAVAGSVIGASLTHRIPANALRLVFGIVIMVVAARMWSASNSAPTEQTGSEDRSPAHASLLAPTTLLPHINTDGTLLAEVLGFRNIGLDLPNHLADLSGDDASPPR